MEIRIGLCLTIIFNLVMIPVMIDVMGIIFKKDGWLDLTPLGYAAIVIILGWNLVFLIILRSDRIVKKVYGEQRGK